MVADALCHKPQCTIACLIHNEWDPLKTLSEFVLEMVEAEDHVSIFTLEARPNLVV